MASTPRRLLLVEDEDTLRQSLAASLAAEGYEVVVACDGWDAVRQVQEQHFDLVITEVAMPGLDGLSTFRQIRQIRPAMVVMLITGYVSEALITEALAEGAYTVLYKPFLMQHFTSLVARAVSRSLILIIEDERHAPNLVSSLRNVGLRASSALDITSALSLVSAGGVDVCILDLGLATALGPRLCEQIHRIDPKVSVIAFAGAKRPRGITKPQRTGCYTHLRQPLDTRELVHAIARARHDCGTV